MKQMHLQSQAPTAGTSPLIAESRRVPLEKKVILKFHHFGGFFIEYSANVSLTGMFIKTDAPKPAGSIFIFEIWLGDEHKLVHGVGEVVWMRSEDQSEGRPAGMGIRFLKIDAESRAVIQRVITEHLEKGGEIFDLDLDGPEKSSGEGVNTESRTELSLVEPGSRPISQADLLVVDEDLLGFEGSPAEEPTLPVGLHTDTPSSGRGLRVALILAILGVVMGGAAYLFSADLLPF